jgi:hypothetical protein
VELFEAVRVAIDRIKNTTLHGVFLEWMDRLKKCIQTNGEYTE